METRIVPNLPVIEFTAEDRMDRGFAEIRIEVTALRAELYRALLIHGFVITGAVIVAAVVLANIFRTVSG